MIIDALFVVDAHLISKWLLIWFIFISQSFWYHIWKVLIFKSVD